MGEEPLARSKSQLQPPLWLELLDPWPGSLCPIGLGRFAQIGLAGPEGGIRLAPYPHHWRVGVRPLEHSFPVGLGMWAGKVLFTWLGRANCSLALAHAAAGRPNEG